MQKPDIIKLIRILSANYRKWPEEGKEEDTVILWEMMLSDIPMEAAQNAAIMHMRKSPFPPAVSDIVEGATRLTNPPQLDWSEAWEMVNGAVRRYGFYREAEGLASLPEDVATMTKRFTWREICLNENIDTLRAQFRMAWETQSKRLKEKSIMPPALSAMLESSNLVKRLE